MKGRRPTLAQGKRADLVIVNAQPQVDLDALSNVVPVLKDGSVVVDREYVFGTFMDGFTTNTFGVWTGGGEVLRSAIRSTLQTWK